MTNRESKKSPVQFDLLSAGTLFLQLALLCFIPVSAEAAPGNDPVEFAQSTGRVPNQDDVEGSYINQMQSTYDQLANGEITRAQADQRISNATQQYASNIKEFGLEKTASDPAALLINAAQDGRFQEPTTAGNVVSDILGLGGADGVAGAMRSAESERIMKGPDTARPAGNNANTSGDSGEMAEALVMGLTGTGGGMAGEIIRGQYDRNAVNRTQNNITGHQEDLMQQLSTMMAPGFVDGRNMDEMMRDPALASGFNQAVSEYEQNIRNELGLPDDAPIPGELSPYSTIMGGEYEHILDQAKDDARATQGERTAQREREADAQTATIEGFSTLTEMMRDEVIKEQADKELAKLQGLQTQFTNTVGGLLAQLNAGQISKEQYDAGVAAARSAYNGGVAGLDEGLLFNGGYAQGNAFAWGEQQSQTAAQQGAQAVKARAEADAAADGQQQDGDADGESEDDVDEELADFFQGVSDQIDKEVEEQKQEDQELLDTVMADEDLKDLFGLGGKKGPGEDDESGGKDKSPDENNTAPLTPSELLNPDPLFTDPERGNNRRSSDAKEELERDGRDAIDAWLDGASTGDIAEGLNTRAQAERLGREDAAHDRANDNTREPFGGRSSGNRGGFGALDDLNSRRGGGFTQRGRMGPDTRVIQVNDDMRGGVDSGVPRNGDESGGGSRGGGSERGGS